MKIDFERPMKNESGERVPGGTLDDIFVNMMNNLTGVQEENVGQLRGILKEIREQGEIEIKERELDFLQNMWEKAKEQGIPPLIVIYNVDEVLGVDDG